MTIPLRAEWLGQVLTVPYVPVLGQVHPGQFTPGTFADMVTEVVAAGRSGTVLPFDKQRRWSTRPTETTLVDEVTHRSDHTSIPTLSCQGAGTVKTFYYGNEPDLTALRAATREWCDLHGAANGRVAWFVTEPIVPAAGVSLTRLLLKEFSHHEPVVDPSEHTIVELDSCAPEVAASLAIFADAMAEHGFAFLHRQHAVGGVGGPILVSLSNETIVGAIGPLTILPDRIGRRMLLPQYFGVLPEHRGHGHGRALWRAVEHWAVGHQAEYQLLQTRVGQPSDRLFLSEGLRSLGYRATVTA